MERFAVVLIDRETGGASTAYVLSDEALAISLAGDAEDSDFMCRSIRINDAN